MVAAVQGLSMQKGHAERSCPDFSNGIQSLYAVKENNIKATNAKCVALAQS